MTAEICMMNRLAVVLAADSATTVSRWVDGKREERYFKGANKVFQLSDRHPVGLMIFDSADILNVPWEVIVKGFRDNLGKKSFNTVEEYATELFQFLNDNPRFFPEDVQNDQLCKAARGTAFMWLAEAVHNVEPDKKQASVDALFAQKRAAIDKVDVSPCLGEDLLAKAAGDLQDMVAAHISEFARLTSTPHPADLSVAAETVLIEVMKRPEHYLSTTGLVVAGYGDHEIFPAMVEYVSSGIVAGRHIYRQHSSMRLNHEQPAWLSAFAQTEMVDTFSSGLSMDMYASLMVAINENLTGFAEEVATSSGGNFAAIDDLDSVMQATSQKIIDEVLDKAMKEHSLPLRSVLGVLPVDEMAELAETLITLQSLKEKVTKPSATVGGPVDVAIITKHEGLVWVKRKHFFNSDLNSRFALRQAAKHS
jgi:hypothetical protein